MNEFIFQNRIAIPSDVGPWPPVAWFPLSTCFQRNIDIASNSQGFTADFGALEKHVYCEQFLQFTPFCGGRDLCSAAEANNSNKTQESNLSPLSFL
jgi:hypothetical protein